MVEVIDSGSLSCISRVGMLKSGRVEAVGSDSIMGGRGLGRKTSSEFAWYVELVEV